LAVAGDQEFEFQLAGLFAAFIAALIGDGIAQNYAVR
jgi:hypothetical protein